MANRGQFQKGEDPRRNTEGRAFTRANVAKAAKAAPGHDGVVAYAGYVSTGEKSSKLTGSQKWVTFANAYHYPAVAIAQQLRSYLVDGVTWSLKPNEAGSTEEQKRGVEVCQQGLLDARLPKPWPEVASKAANTAYFEGFSIHATALGRRKDGQVVFTDIDHRPGHTIEKWWRKNKGKAGPFTLVEQRTPDGETFEIPLDECLYLVNDSISSSPEGVGVLRLVVERLRRIDKYEGLEGSEMFSSMGGMPIPRAPIEEIATNASGTEEQKRAAVLEATQQLRDVAAERVKSPEKQPYMMLDSATYRGTDPNTVSTVKKWDIEIVKSEQQGLPETRKTINDYDLGVARVLGIEFVYSGGNDSAGTYGQHESKVQLFAASLTSWLVRLANRATQQLLRRLCVMNGIDPDTACPTLVPSPVRAIDVMLAVDMLVKLSMAGLKANHAAKKLLFERAGLPWEDEDEPVLPRATSGGGGSGQPEPEDEEDDPDNLDEDKEPKREPVTEKLKRLRAKEQKR